MESKYLAPFCFGYRKLAPSYGQEPLLLDNDMGNHSECMEALKSEMDAIVKKIKTRNMALESDLRSAISRIDKSKKSTDSVHENKIEKQVGELRSAVSRVESMVNPKRILADKEDIVKLSKKSSELEKKVMEMATTINELKAASSHFKGAMAKLIWEKTELEKRVKVIESTVDQRVKVTASTVDQVKAALSDFNGKTQSMGVLWPEPRSQDPGMSDLIRCLLMLIFLICLLIGINLRSM